MSATFKAPPKVIAKPIKKKVEKKTEKKPFEGRKMFNSVVVEIVILGNSNAWEWLENREGEVLEVVKGINNNFFQTKEYVNSINFGLIPFRDAELI